jgi:hypothetical protein
MSLSLKKRKISPFASRRPMVAQGKFFLERFVPTGIIFVGTSSKAQNYLDSGEMVIDAKKSPNIKAIPQQFPCHFFEILRLFVNGKSECGQGFNRRQSLLVGNNSQNLAFH